MKNLQCEYDPSKVLKRGVIEWGKNEKENFRAEAPARVATVTKFFGINFRRDVCIFQLLKGGGG